MPSTLRIPSKKNNQRRTFFSLLDTKMLFQTMKLTIAEGGTAFRFQPSADPEGGRGQDPRPLKNKSDMGFYREKAIGPPPPPWKKFDPLPPLENVGHPLEPGPPPPPRRKFLDPRMSADMGFTTCHVNSDISCFKTLKIQISWLQAS